MMGRDRDGGRRLGEGPNRTGLGRMSFAAAAGVGRRRESAAAPEMLAAVTINALRRGGTWPGHRGQGAAQMRQGPKLGAGMECRGVARRPGTEGTWDEG